MLMLNQAALGYGLLAGGRYNFDRNQTSDRNCSATPLTTPPNLPAP